MKSFKIFAVVDLPVAASMPVRCIVAETPMGFVNLLTLPYKLWHNSVTDERSVYVGQTTRLESASIEGLCQTIHGKSIEEYEKYIQTEGMKVWEDED